MSDWNAYTTVDSLSPIASAAEEYLRLSEQMARIADRLDVLGEQIAAHFPESPGEHGLIIGNRHVVTCKRPEVWSWDTDILEQMFGTTTEPPAPVKRRYTVDKRKFQALEDGDKAALLPALTRKPGKAKIEVLEMVS